MRQLNLATMALVCITNTLLADDWQSAAEAPPNHAILAETLNGWIFVPKELKETYDNTLRRLESLQSSVNAGTIDTKEAKTELDELKARLKLLRVKIEASQIEVEGKLIHEQTESIEFALGPEKRLAITANDVRIKGWEGPNVKVELKKLVLSNLEEAVDDQLKAICIVHELGIAKFAGQTDAEWESQETEFMAKEGATLTKEQREDRRKFVDEIRQGYAHYREVLGKEIDQLSIKGLDYESNKVIPKNVRSKDGNGQIGSVRQRYGELTVYVPACTSVHVRGARRGLRVNGLSASLKIVPEDSTDSDARGVFEVIGLRGNLWCRDFPLHTISKVNGHVDIESTTDFAVEGAGTNHRDDLRSMTPGRPFNVEVHDVTGGIRLRYGRVQLSLANIAGTIDVENDFGSTRMKLEAPLNNAAHRIISQSGRIDVELNEAAWNSIPVIAATNHGGTSTNFEREEFDDFNLSGQDKKARVRRNWNGFRKVVAGEDPFAVFNLIERFAAVAENGERKSGLDLFSRSGTVTVLRK